MTVDIEWLPPLVLLQDFGGDWNRYVEAIYACFRADFVEDRPLFRGAPVWVRREPSHRGKESGFWHVTSSGPVEEEREPDLRRCECIRWPRPVIEHETDRRVKVWSERHQGRERLHLWLDDRDYLVVVEVRPGHAMLVTAFTTLEEHQRKKHARRFARAHKPDAATL